MLDIHNLERRWLKYKAKSYAPFIGIFILVLFLSIITYNGKNTNKSESSQTMDQTEQVENNNASDKKTSGEISSNLLEPSMEFIQSFQTSTQTPLASTPIAPKSVALTNGAIPTPKVLNVPDSSTLKVSTVSVSAPNDKAVSLKMNESKLDIESIERRFKETSNPSLGLFIARYYYDHGNYNNAYNFALKTNSISNKMDESWIIFAKSLVKLGRIDQAKKTLQLYILESNSDAARSLLDSIEQGTFK